MGVCKHGLANVCCSVIISVEYLRSVCIAFWGSQSPMFCVFACVEESCSTLPKAIFARVAIALEWVAPSQYISKLYLTCHNYLLSIYYYSKPLHAVYVHNYNNVQSQIFSYVHTYVAST